MTTLVLADQDPEFAKEIKLALSDTKDIKIAAVTRSFNHLLPLIEEHHPTVIMLGPNLDTRSVSDTLAANEELFADDCFIIFDPAEGDKIEVPENITSERLSPPLHQADLLEAIERMTENFTAPAGEGNGKIVTVFSTKGGVGKTVIASNLTVALIGRPFERVVVLDLDLQFGDVGVMLNLQPKHTIYDCTTVSDELNPELMNKFLTPHSSGAQALLAPLQPEYADLVSAEDVKNVLDTLKSRADLVVVDTPPTFNDHVLTLLDETDIVLLVATMDIPSIKNIKLCLQTLKSLQFPETKVMLVINRADENVGLKLNEVEESLHTVATATIPSDRRVPLSINRGVPVVIDAPKSAAAKSLTRLAANIKKELISGPILSAAA